MIERATSLHAALLAFHRNLSTKGEEPLSKDEHAAYDREFWREVVAIGRAFEERGIRGASIPTFAVIGPYAGANPDTLALAADRLREAIERAASA